MEWLILAVAVIAGRRLMAGNATPCQRAKYAPRLDAIAVLLAAPPGLWIGDRSFLGARTSH